jgi:amino acid transporter
VAVLDYRSLIGMSNVSVAVQYAATCAAIPLLRRRAPSGRRVRGGPIIPMLGVGVSLWIFTEASPEELVWSAGALAIGLALLAFSHRRASASKTRCA